MLIYNDSTLWYYNNSLEEKKRLVSAQDGAKWMRTLTYGPYTIELYMEESSQSIVYAVMDGQCAEDTWRLLNGHKLALAAISGVDWNRELSPWPAPKAFRGGSDFDGGAPAFLRKLAEHIVPLVENRLIFRLNPVPSLAIRWQGCLRCGPHSRQTHLTAPPPFPAPCGMTDFWSI